MRIVKNHKMLQSMLIFSGFGCAKSMYAEPRYVKGNQLPRGYSKFDELKDRVRDVLFQRSAKRAPHQQQSMAPDASRNVFILSLTKFENFHN